VLVGAAIVGVVVLSVYNKKRRLGALTLKYGSPEIAKAIMNKKFWQGQTSEQLAESLGNPAGVDRKILRDRTREIWKYDQRGRNQYGLRITLENGNVIGWDQKG